MRQVLLIAALAVSACVSNPPAPYLSREDLVGTEWVMLNETIGDAAAPTIAFGPDRASGFAGCNRWFASFDRSGFDDVGTTRMMCSPPAMDVETGFKYVLEETVGFSLENGELQLYDSDLRTLARFRRTN